MITSRANTLISFFFAHSLRVYSNVLRRAMKVDKHKYNDVFRCDKFFFWEILIKMLNWRVWGFFALRFSHFMALNKSFLKRNRRKGKDLFQCFHSFRSVNLPESNYTSRNPTMSLRNILAAPWDMGVMAGVECRNLAVQQIRIPYRNLTWNPCRIFSTSQSDLILNSQESLPRSIHFRQFLEMRKIHNLIHSSFILSFFYLFFNFSNFF